MNMIGEKQTRIRRMNTAHPANETRWLVPAKPYTPPKGSRESIEHTVMMIAAGLVIVFVWAAMILSEVM